MPFRIKSGDLIIETDTKRELMEALEVLGIRPDAPDGYSERLSQGEPGEGEAVEPRPVALLSEQNLLSRLARFKKIISGSSQDDLIRFLVEAFPKGFRDDAIRTKLNLGNNRELGPIFTAITKNANRCSLPAVICKELTDSGGGDGKYVYFLTEEIGTALKAMEKSEEEQKSSVAHSDYSGDSPDDIPF